MGEAFVWVGKKGFEVSSRGKSRIDAWVTHHFQVIATLRPNTVYTHTEIKRFGGRIYFLICRMLLVDLHKKHILMGGGFVKFLSHPAHLMTTHECFLRKGVVEFFCILYHLIILF